MIYQNGKEIDKISMDSSCIKTIECNDGYNIIQVKDGTVSIIEADCKNQICVNTGQISHNGEVISCLPHGLIVKVVSTDEKEVDTVAY